MPGAAKVLISDKDWNYKYAVTASKEWETVEIDISDLNGLTVYFSIEDLSSVMIANPKLVGEGSSQVVKQDPGFNVVSSNAIVNVNGEIIDFEAYNIDENNYFKLRDLAAVLSGSEKQFEVGWDEVNKSINLVSGQAYTTVGGELTKSDVKEIQAIESASSIYKDGEEVELKAYTIGSNNYFKLRDIGKAFNFGIDWDENTKSIKIDTSIEYTE